MAGNSQSGRSGQSAEVHVLRGTFRADRHGGKFDRFTGKPKRPLGLDEIAAVFWDTTIRELVKSRIAKRIDGPAVQQLAELWSLYRRAVIAANINPLDKLARVAVMNYLAAFNSLAARFGLTPADRLRLNFAPRPTSSEDEFETFLAHGVAKKRGS